MTASIGCGTGPGNEAIAGAHMAAVGTQGSRDAASQPLRSLGRRVESLAYRHQKLSSTAATICGLTAMSG